MKSGAFCILVLLMACENSKNEQIHDNYQYLTNKELRWVTNVFLYFDDWDVVINIFELRKQKGMISESEFIKKYNAVRDIEQCRVISIRNVLASKVYSQGIYIMPELWIGSRFLEERRVFDELHFLIKKGIVTDDALQNILEKINFQEIYIVKDRDEIGWRFLR